MSLHDDPVVSRIKTPRKQSRSEMRGQWHDRWMVTLGHPSARVLRALERDAIHARRR